MKVHSKRVISFFLMMSMIFGVFSGIVAFSDGASAAPEYTEITDNRGAVIRTERGEDYTKITYSMTLGNKGTSGNYVTKYTSAGDDFYVGAPRGAEGNVGIVFKLPLYVADSVTSVSMDITRTKNGALGIYANIAQPAVIADRNVAKYYSSLSETEIVGEDITSGVVETIANAERTPTDIYLTLGSGTAEVYSEYNSPAVSAVSITVTYGTVWETETDTQTDSYGATVTTTKIKTAESGVGSTRVTYSMTAGTSGTYGGYAIEKGTEYDGYSKASNANGTSRGILLKLPVIYADSFAGITATALRDTSDLGQHRVYVAVNEPSMILDTENNVEVDHKIGAEYILSDGSTQAKAMLKQAENTDCIYVTFGAASGEYNATRVREISVTVTYDTVWTEDTYTDSHGAVITTLHVGETTVKKYSMTCGLSGTHQNYYVGKGAQKSGYDGDYKSNNTTYRFPLLYAEDLVGLVGTFTVNVHNFKLYVGIDSAAENTATDGTGVIFGEPVAAIDTWNEGEYTFDFTSAVKALLQSNADMPAEYVYIRFDNNTNDNAPFISALELTAEYDSYLEETAINDSYGASVRTVERNATTTKSIYTMLAGTAGTSGGYCVDIGNSSKSGETYYACGYDAVVYKLPLNDTFVHGIVTANIGGSYSNSNIPRALYISIADPKGDIKNMTLVAISATNTSDRRNYCYDITDTLLSLLENNSDASEFYIAFYGTEWNNNPAVYSVSATLAYGTDETVNDSQGAEITSTFFGDTFNRRYYMTAGNKGTSGNYCERIGNEGKATDTTYSGGDKDTNKMGIVYRFPIEFRSLTGIKFFATTDSMRGLYVAVSESAKYSTQRSDYVEIYQSVAWEAKATYEYDIEDTVLSLIEETPNAKYLYLSISNASDWTAPNLHDIELSMTYAIESKNICKHSLRYATEAIRATCVDEGVELWVCDTCGDLIQAVAKKSDHSFNEWDPVEGGHRGTCSVCGTTVTEAHISNTNGMTEIGHTVSQTRVNTPVVIANSVVTDAEYARAVQYNNDTTNISLLQSVMNRAKNGEDITVAALGGSITEGWGASDRSSTCYAALYADWWRTAFPMSNVTFVNAGIGGTTSYFGAHRLDEAVLSKSADVCVIDFTVNDRTDAHFLASYESIIARLLANDVAVIALYMIAEDGFNVKSAHHKIVEKYRLPSISYADAIWQTFSDGTRVWDDISDDSIHPNDAGHAYTAELFWRYLNSIYEFCPEQVVATKGIDDPFLLIPKYHDSHMADSDSTLINVSSYEGFEKNSNKVIKNHTNGWYSATGVGEICFSASFDTLGMLYKNAASGEVRGGFDVYIDGKLITPHTTSKAYFGMTEILYESAEVAREHTVRIVFDGEYGAMTVGGFLLSSETDAGMYDHPCVKCGKSDGVMQALKQTGHDLGNGNITEKPTLTSKGEIAFSCECGYSFTEELPAITLPTIGSMYLNITEDINVFYTVTVPENAENVYAIFSFRDKQYTVTDYTVLEDGRYAFKYSGVAPSYMNHKIGIEVYATFYGDEYKVTDGGCSIREYYEWVQNAYSQDTELLRLLSDLLVYCEKAQIYTDVETDSLVTDGLTLTPTEQFVKPDSILSLSGTAENALADWVGTGLHCDEKMNIYFTFTATDITNLTVTVTINGRTYEYTAEDFIKVAEGKYRINVERIFAYEFNDEITATFSANGVQTGRVLTYSINSYISSAYVAQGDALSDLLAAIYNYGVSAAAYKATLNAQN